MIGSCNTSKDVMSLEPLSYRNRFERTVHEERLFITSVSVMGL